MLGDFGSILPLRNLLTDWCNANLGYPYGDGGRGDADVASEP